MNNEQERLKRLRDRQLADRDPLVKQKKFQQTTAHKERKERGKSYSIVQAWRTIPHIYRTPFICLLLGLAVMIVLPMLWISPWSFWVALGVTVFAVMVGIFFGRAQDIRETLKDALRH